ncbi:hypothetical protein FALBO_12415 [Fusarium albosuccineum]|uniref:Secreted protein n=1 Tax=Fusarium albosuccineum TaxID=1237068 RepID=A0A8H4P6A6_9HYPO|nr:hypothetical protein FALBO_12415 [Fusarium albosuccineum]
MGLIALLHLCSPGFLAPPPTPNTSHFSPIQSQRSQSKDVNKMPFFRARPDFVAHRCPSLESHAAIDTHPSRHWLRSALLFSTPSPGSGSKIRANVGGRGAHSRGVQPGFGTLSITTCVDSHRPAELSTP